MEEEQEGERVLGSSSGEGACSEGYPTLLDSMLDSVFGTSFSSVIEFESKRALGTNLQCAMDRDPSRAYRLLRSVFVFEEAVDLILANVLGKVARVSTSQEHRDLRALLVRVLESKPIAAEAESRQRKSSLQ